MTFKTHNEAVKYVEKNLYNETGVINIIQDLNGKFYITITDGENCFVVFEA